MGDEPPRGMGPGGASAQGRSADHWEASLEGIVQDLVVSTSGDENTGGRV